MRVRHYGCVYRVLVRFGILLWKTVGGCARYDVVTAAALDREGREHYSLTVACVDSGVPPLTGRTTLDVRVSDVNDNAPVFRDGDAAATRIDVTVAERNAAAAAGDYVVTVAADDADSAENGAVSYAVRCRGDDDAGAVLQVDAATGIVRTAAAVSLDRERRAEYDCEVVAADAGVPSLSSSVQLRLIVADVDDERATFERRSYEFAVAENTAAGAAVGRVTARDADQPPFNRVVYQLVVRTPTSLVSIRHQLVVRTSTSPVSIRLFIFQGGSVAE